MGVSLLIGLQQRERPIDRERFLRIGLEWIETNIGIKAEITEVDGLPTVRIIPGSLPVRPEGVRS
jgi:hypothetical protein